MLALTSAAFRRSGAACFSELQQAGADADEEVLTKLRELVHTGSADFAGDSWRFFQAFHLTEVLEMWECYGAFCEAVEGQRGHGRHRVELGPMHERSLSAQIAEMYKTYPRNVPAGHFDTHFVLEGSTVPRMQGHRLVLAAAAGYFRALLEQDKHVQAQVDEPWRIELGDLSEAVLRAVLDLTYTGQASVGSEHFASLALQADGWQADAVSEACLLAVVNRQELAQELLKGGYALPENLTIAVAYSLPEVVRRHDDVDAFIMLLMSPVLATHLSTSFAFGGAYIDYWDQVGPMWDAPEILMRSKGLGKGWGKLPGKSTVGYGMAEGVGDVPVGTQLERFIDGPGFRSFLTHPAALKLPSWSVSMVLESWFIRLTDRHAGHPPRAHGKGRAFTRDCWAPDDWAATSEKVVTWLLRWAGHQRELTSEPTFRSLLQVRGAIWHPRGLSSGEPLRRQFWLQLFRAALQEDPASICPLMLEADGHFAKARELSAPTGRSANYKGRGKGKAVRDMDQQVAIRRWTNAHACYEAAFLVAAAGMQRVGALGEQAEGWPWWTVSAATLLRLLASEAAPSDADGVEGIVLRWLSGGLGGSWRSLPRVLALSVQVANLRQVLEYPLETASAPKFLRHAVPPERLLALLSQVLDRLAVAAAAAEPEPAVGSAGGDAQPVAHHPALPQGESVAVAAAGASSP